MSDDRVEAVTQARPLVEVRRFLAVVSFEQIKVKHAGVNQPKMPSQEPFDTTHWSVILAARDGDSPKARAAPGELCRAYWYPLYAFIRHRGHDHQTAEDLTQMFFTRFRCAVASEGTMNHD